MDDAVGRLRRHETAGAVAAVHRIDALVAAEPRRHGVIVAIEEGRWPRVNAARRDHGGRSIKSAVKGPNKNESMHVEEPPWPPPC